MKLTYKTQKIGLLAAFVSLLIISACKDDLPKAMDTSAKETVLNSIKIVNIGQNGDVVLNGVVDENAKTVSFPRIDTLTKDPITGVYNFKIEAEVSNGASLDKEIYPVTFAEGQSEKVITVKVMNSPRYREYLVTLRLKVPVYGADFSTYATYDFTANPLGNPIYSDFAGAATRGTGFDGEKILIVKRDGSAALAHTPHLLNVSDLKNGVINKIMLNTTGIAGGTFGVNMGALVNGHIYIANLSGGLTSPLKIYHWTDPSAAPNVILNQNVADIIGANPRHGDNFSIGLDDQGNGFIYFVDNTGAKVLRYEVTNYTTVNNPTVFPAPVAGGGSWATYNRIGNTAEYLYTGHGAQLGLVTDAGSALFTTTKMTTTATGTSFPLISSDARIVNFNGERYLITTTAARTGSDFTSFRVYDITKGATVKEALTNLDNLPTITPIFDYALAGPVNTSPASQTGFYVKKDAQGKDEKLMLYAGASDAGFVFFEFSKKVGTD